jgi:hypothetical protein
MLDLSRIITECCLDQKQKKSYDFIAIVINKGNVRCSQIQYDKNLPLMGDFDYDSLEKSFLSMFSHLVAVLEETRRHVER